MARGARSFWPHRSSSWLIPSPSLHPCPSVSILWLILRASSLMLLGTRRGGAHGSSLILPRDQSRSRLNRDGFTLRAFVPSCLSAPSVSICGERRLEAWVISTFRRFDVSLRSTRTFLSRWNRDPRQVRLPITICVHLRLFPLCDLCDSAVDPYPART